MCSIANDFGEEGVDFGNVFWIINGSVYGLLQVPVDFSVCSSESCDLNSLAIPVPKSEMNGTTIQCVGIDYHNNTLYLGGVTVLEVFPLPQGQLNRNGKSPLTTNDTSLKSMHFRHCDFQIAPAEMCNIKMIFNKKNFWGEGGGGGGGQQVLLGIESSIVLHSCTTSFYPERNTRSYFGSPPVQHGSSEHYHRMDIQ